MCLCILIWLRLLVPLQRKHRHRCPPGGLDKVAGVVLMKRKRSGTARIERDRAGLDAGETGDKDVDVTGALCTQAWRAVRESPTPMGRLRPRLPTQAAT